MNQDSYRRLVLSMPEAVEMSHMGHPDFRVNNKIFATIWPDEEWGMVKLTPAQQKKFVKLLPEAFSPVKGGWGKRGCTQVRLDKVDRTTLRTAVVTAWVNTAPKRLAKEYGLADQS